MFQTEVVEKIVTHFAFSNVLLKILNSLDNEKKNIVQQDRPQMTLYYSMCALRAGWLRLETHSEYVTLISFPWQQCLCE